MDLGKYGQINDMPRGWVSESIVNKRIYSMWFNMLSRCFCDEFSKDYLYYKDCKVHPDFLLLSNFVNWVESEPNYPLLVEDPSPHKWSIDKDGLITGNKEYCPGKIRLITNSENKKEEIRRNGTPTHNNPYCVAKSVIGVNIKDLTLKYYKSIKDTSKDGFTPNNISNCCKSVRKTHKGYKWFYTTNLLNVMNYLYMEVK